MDSIGAPLVQIGHWSDAIRFREGCTGCCASPDTGQQGGADFSAPESLSPAGKQARATTVWQIPMKFFITVLALAGLAAPCAFAQEQAPIVITGSLLPRTLGSEIAASSVLTRADIREHGEAMRSHD